MGSTEAIDCQEAELSARPSRTVLDQNFSRLESSIEEGIWEADGHDFALYVSEPHEPEGGAVLVSGEDHKSWAEIVHSFGTSGERVTRISASIICELLDQESLGRFSMGLAYNEDIEECSFFSVTLKRPMPDAGEECDVAAAVIRPVELRVNGELACSDVGKLPVRLDVEADLSWGSIGGEGEPSGARTVNVRHQLTQVTDVATETSASTRPGASASGETQTGFYTTGVKFDTAMAAYFRTVGVVKVRFLRFCCCVPATS